jgi:hypothetical protein
MIKKLPVLFKTLPLLLLVLGALVAACVTSQYTRGIPFEPETLGLNPGSTTSNLGFNWYANTDKGNKSMVRIFDEKGSVVSTSEGTVVPVCGKISPQGASERTQTGNVLPLFGIQ